MSLAPCFVLIKTDFTQAIFKLYGAQDDLDLLILMCLFPKGWDYSHVVLWWYCDKCTYSL